MIRRILAGLYLLHAVQMLIRVAWPESEPTYGLGFLDDVLWLYAAALSFLAALVLILRFRYAWILVLLRSIHGIVLAFQLGALSTYTYIFFHFFGVFQAFGFVAFLGIWPHVLFAATIIIAILKRDKLTHPLISDST